MDNEKRGLTCEEWLKIYGPAWEKMEAEIRSCIAGLTIYAANLAAEGRTNDVVMLRKRIDVMSAFWFGGDEDHTGVFNMAISEVMKGDVFQPLTEPEKADVLKGLKTNNRQMASDLDDVETIVEFDELSEWLGSQWSSEAQIRQDFGGMQFG